MRDSLRGEGVADKAESHIQKAPTARRLAAGGFKEWGVK